MTKEIFRVEIYQLFREGFGLDEEEPPEVARGEFLLGSFVHGLGGRNVDEDRLSHELGPIEREAVADASAPVVSDKVATLHPENLEELSQVLGHHALAVGPLTAPDD